MIKLLKLEKVEDSPDYSFYCPGCECDHGVWTTESNNNKAIWQFNDDMDKPTFSPSLLIHHGAGIVCHSFIREGKIEYLSDCTHKFAGQTIEMEDYETEK
jgi:hypothetical protein